MQKILDYAIDTDLPQDKYEKLIMIVEEHIPIAEENMARRAVQMMAQQGTMPGPEAQPPPTEQLAQMEPRRTPPQPPKASARKLRTNYHRLRTAIPTSAV